MADRVVGNLSIRLDFDGAKFEQGITKAKRELASYGKATRMSTNIAKDSNFERGKTVDALNNMQVKYKAIQGTIGEYNKMNEKLIANGQESSGQFEKNATHIQNLEYDMYELNEEYKAFQKESLIAQSNFTKMGSAMEKIGGRVTQFGDGMSQVGNGLTKLGAMGAATIGVFAKQAIDFESGMVQVQKTTNATAEQMAVFEEQMRGLALEMPLAVGELQNLAAQAGQLGVAQDDIAEFVETVAMIGTATNLSSEQAGESLARFQNVTGSSVDSLDNLGSALVHLGKSYCPAVEKLAA